MAGAYQITKHLGKVTYELYMLDKLKKTSVFSCEPVNFRCLHCQSSSLASSSASSVPLTGRKRGSSYFPPTALSQEQWMCSISSLSSREKLLDPEHFQKKKKKALQLWSSIPEVRCYSLPEVLQDPWTFSAKAKERDLTDVGIIEILTSKWCGPIVCP